MVKIRVLSKCQHCDGKAYLPIGEGFDFKGESYTRHIPCPVCEGSGLAAQVGRASRVLAAVGASKMLPSTYRQHGRISPE